MLVRTSEPVKSVVRTLDKNGQWHRDPTGSEIRDACREIQSHWTVAERARRLVKPSGWR
ncbi:hypothetical protein [Planctellipticum variicoloris]|uniref:hypothetical protein n=1 Tax=Planctellipticum variicoloris TaxID=3064265 RepID=UPI002BD236D3|nr:hypothetical protein SH412_003697 [Planctomycetaceae bacterium SH412]HTN03994.1 hypothetical protein [Planctomycetaceae bacterium]